MKAEKGLLSSFDLVGSKFTSELYCTIKKHRVDLFCQCRIFSPSLNCLQTRRHFELDLDYQGHQFCDFTQLTCLKTTVRGSTHDRMLITKFVHCLIRSTDLSGSVDLPL